ncbi:actin cytoskeleton-regulatory complex protein pan1-like [Olea europaea var. sylvestris]|uniref:actin cytoskeleton-regulatory complex protein pan1-like n=1 Tax=Olea europaea var. sylvestris TaxID=158386 RepID=UPI000C1D2F18|nr:actin cytoskeleton-regulatory complex protein pan1-like [Olea europaea var. sylvestris]
MGGCSEVDRYAMAEEAVDYTQEWGASRVPSNMTGKRLGELRERYSVPHYIEMLVPEPNERACYPRPGCVAEIHAIADPSSAERVEPTGRLVLPDSSTRFELSREEFEVIEDIYKRPLKLRHFDHLIDRSRYFLDFELMASRDKFKKREYPALDMASILKATSTAKARPLKLGSSGAKKVRGRVERLSKDCTPRASEEATTQRPEKPKELRGKEKVSEENKKRKLVHISSSAGKFGTSVSHRTEQTGEPKLLAAASKAIKIEMVREVEAKEAREKAARRAAEAAEEEAAKEKPVREKGKEALSEFQTRTHASEGKAASLAEEVKAAKAEAEEAKAQRVEEAAKLESALAQVEALKKEMNLSLVGAPDAYQFLEGQAKWYMNDASVAREEARTAREEAVKEYIANFHTTEEYKSFSSYWRNFAYIEVLERAEELYPNLDLAQLRSEFVDEVPQTPAEEVQGDEEVDAEAPSAEAEKTTTDAQVAEAPSAEAPPSSSQAYTRFYFSVILDVMARGPLL